MRYIKKDVTTVESGVIPHGVNCKGKMASGVAKAIKEKWPKVYNAFMEIPPSPANLGRVQSVRVDYDVYVVNCFTQRSYGRDPNTIYADPDAIYKTLSKVFRFAYFNGKGIYMPKIGCGLGGLNWETDVAPIITELENLYPGVEVYVCEI